MKKKITLCLILFIVIFLCVGLYKFLLFKKYPINISNINSFYNNLENLPITIIHEISDEKIGNLNISIPQEFQEKKSIDENSKIYTLNDIIEIWIAKKDRPFIEDVDENEKAMYETIFEKYNINNELDLIKIYKNHKRDKVKFLWSKSKIMFHHIASEYINKLTEFGQNTKCYYLTNDLDGLLIQGSKFITAYIFNDDESYILRFNTKDFSIEKTTKILSTIHF